MKINTKMLLAAGLLILGNQALAQFTNGSFEDGTFNGWTLDWRHLV